MVARTASCLVLVALGAASQARAADTAPPQKVDSPASAARAMLVLKNNCFACHNPEKKKGGLILTSRDAALRGGDDGPVLVPNKPTDSKLVQVLSADADPHMPPKKQLDADDAAAPRD